MAFKVLKWYLDLVAPDGTVAILYCGWVRWGALQVSHSALFLDGPSGSEHRATMRRAEMPESSGNMLRWSCDRLGVVAAWERRAPAFQCELPTEVDGGATWFCACPRAAATLTVDGRRLQGEGYAERLELLVKPWELGLAELRWGHAAHAGTGVVWIEWRGRVPFGVAVVNGAGAELTSADEERVTWEGGAISLTQRRVITQTPVAEQVRSIPMVARVAPLAFLAAEQTRILSHATVTLPKEKLDDAGVPGVALHEVVRFPTDPAA